jgi:hypothetical protein
VQVRLFFLPSHFSQFDHQHLIVCPISEIMRIRQTFSAEYYLRGSSCSTRVFSLLLSLLVGRVLPMFRMALSLGSVAILIVAAAGCQMCCHPYDHSGPVFSDDGLGASSHTRAGSILSGNPHPSISPTTSPTQDKSVSPSPTPSPTPDQARKHHKSFSYVMSGNQSQGAARSRPQQELSGTRPQGPLLGKAQPGDVAGSERIVSVTERTVGPSADSSQIADDPSPTPAKSLPSAGWTARRPTTDLMR